MFKGFGHGEEQDIVLGSVPGMDLNQVRDDVLRGGRLGAGTTSLGSLSSGLPRWHSMHIGT